VKHLTARQAILEVSDPWDFCSEQGTGPFPAYIEIASSHGLVLRLPHPLSYRGFTFKSLVATAREVDKGLGTGRRSGPLPVNLTPFEEGEADERTVSPLVAAAKWRRWHLIGTLRLSEADAPSIELYGKGGEGNRGKLSLEIERSALALLEGLGFTKVEERYDKAAFGNELVVFESDVLRLRFLKDRGQIFVELGPTSEPRRWHALNDVLEVTTGETISETAGWLEQTHLLGAKYSAIRQGFVKDAYQHIEEKVRAKEMAREKELLARLEGPDR
jgi:hypothetical protein